MSYMFYDYEYEVLRGKIAVEEKESRQVEVGCGIHSLVQLMRAWRTELALCYVVAKLTVWLNRIPTSMSSTFFVLHWMLIDA